MPQKLKAASLGCQDMLEVAYSAMRAAARAESRHTGAQSNNDTLSQLFSSDVAGIAVCSRVDTPTELSLLLHASTAASEPLNTGIRRSPTRSARPQEGEDAWNGCQASGCNTLAICSPGAARARSGCVARGGLHSAASHRHRLLRTKNAVVQQCGRAGKVCESLCELCKLCIRCKLAYRCCAPPSSAAQQR